MIQTTIVHLSIPLRDVDLGHKPQIGQIVAPSLLLIWHKRSVCCKTISEHLALGSYIQLHPPFFNYPRRAICDSGLLREQRHGSHAKSQQAAED